MRYSSEQWPTRSVRLSIYECLLATAFIDIAIAGQVVGLLALDPGIISTIQSILMHQH